MESADDHRHAVILAGGSGVRFWPQSRGALPKQLLAPLGGGTLLRRTADRLLAVFPADRIWVLTAEHLADSVSRELPEIPARRIIAEPAKRNTAPAIGLAAAMLLREDRDAVMGIFPSDHHLENEERYRNLLERALDAARGDELIVVGIEPTRPETGYGYIEFPEGTKPGHSEPLPVVRFREKPDAATAQGFLASGRFYWNSGQFFWKASAFAAEMAERLPATWRVLTDICGGSEAAFSARLAERYAACESVSVDCGILERSGRVAGFAAPDIGWTDLGSWEALHSLLPKDGAGNCARTPSAFVDAKGNFVDVPGKHVAMVGVDDLVVVETPDALLVCPRDEAQRVAEVVEALREAGRDDLL